jgi:serine/threonine protein kinase
MSQPDFDSAFDRPFAKLPDDVALRMDQLCDCFEQRMRAHKQPRIEAFLGSGESAAAREALLRELLTLEVGYRRDAGDTPSLIDYLTRFPTDVEVVRQVFSRLFPADAALSTTAWLPPDATLVIPNYILLAQLGTGGMGTVYRAVHTLLKNEAAIKVLKSGREDDAHLRELFLQETGNHGQLRHPYIVQALFAGLTESGQPYLVMEMIQGVDLAEVVARCGPLPVADACEIIRQSAVGLQHASDCGMVHRDLKPSNLMLGWVDPRRERAEVKVTDFGLARLRGHSWRKPPDGDEPVMGTFDYMAPEQYFTPAAVDIRADIFSLGCTLHALLVGLPPFAGAYRNAKEKMIAHRDRPAASFRHLRPDVSAALEEIILWMVAKQPSDRFESPQELAGSLAHFTSGHDLPLLLETAQERVAPRKPTPIVSSTIGLPK